MCFPTFCLSYCQCIYSLFMCSSSWGWEAAASEGSGEGTGLLGKAPLFLAPVSSHTHTHTHTEYFRPCELSLRVHLAMPLPPPPPLASVVPVFAQTLKAGSDRSWHSLVAATINPEGRPLVVPNPEPLLDQESCKDSCCFQFHLRLSCVRLIQSHSHLWP